MAVDGESSPLLLSRDGHEAPPSRDRLWPLLLSEFMGTLVMIAFGVGSVAQSVLTKEAAGGPWNIHWSWGYGVTLGMYCSTPSGCHLNPAVSVSLAAIGKLPWRHVPGYAVAQVAGAFSAAAIVYGVYYDALNNFDGGHRMSSGPLDTASIFSTYPQPYLGPLNGIFDQVLGTFFLLTGIMAIIDDQSPFHSKTLQPLTVGFLVTAIGCSFGSNFGYAINPARDFGPRLFTLFTHGPHVFTGAWWLIPILGPLVGALLGTGAYVLCIQIPRKHASMNHDLATPRGSVQ